MGLTFLDNDDDLGLNLEQELAGGTGLATAPESVHTSARASPDVTVKSESDDTLVKMEIDVKTEADIKSEADVKMDDEASAAPSPLTPTDATPPVAARTPTPAPPVKGRGKEDEGGRTGERRQPCPRRRSWSVRP